MSQPQQYYSRGRGNYRPTQSRGSNPPPPPAQPKPAAKPQIEVKGPTDLWLTLQYACDHRTHTTKTTRAMSVPGGVLVNTCTRAAGFACEASVFVPGAQLVAGPTKGMGFLGGSAS